MNHKNLNLQSSKEVGDSLAQRAKAMRLHKGWTRQTMAKRAGVTQSSLKRYENTGRASLELVLKVAHALGRLNEFNQIFLPPPAQSIEELEKQVSRSRRERGKI